MFFHLVKRKGFVFDRYMRVYTDSGRLYFIQVGGDFYNKKAFNASMAGNVIGIALFYFPYYLAKKRERECDELANKKAFLHLVQRSANFKLELREITKIELEPKSFWGQIFSNYSDCIRIEVASGKVYRLDMPFGESADNIIFHFENAGVKIKNQILE